MSATLGTVLERDGAQYRVETAAGECRAILRGKAKREDRDRVVVGDRVQLEPEPGGALWGITAVEPRTSLLERRVPEGRGARPVAANVDLVCVVTAAADPPPLPQLIDRLLVVAEANSIPAVVVLNKIDLAPNEALRARLERAGYPVHSTSVVRGDGLDTLRAALAGRRAVVTGASGVGKSSLLNALHPGLALRVGEISQKIRRGRNTTVGAVMIPLGEETYLVDTPGFSEVGLWGIEPRELARCFPDFRAHLDTCRFPDCRHRTEPGCAVRAAVDAGTIDADRHETYLMLLAELESAPRPWE